MFVSLWLKLAGNFCQSVGCFQVILQLLIEKLATSTSRLVVRMTAEQDEINCFQTLEH